MNLPMTPDIIFYETPAQCWEAIYTDCQAAQTSILCEHYIMENDNIGQHFLNLFIQKAKDGIDVTLILDGIGSRSLIGSPLVQSLRDAGGTITFYKPSSWRLFMKPSRWFPRNHNKIVIIDEITGHIGSACFNKKMENWRDIHMRFTGDIAASLYQKLKYNIKDPVYAQNYTDDVLARGIFYAVSEPYLGRNKIYKMLLQHIHHARDNITLVTPYFLPPYRLQLALYKAARRGVRIQLMLSQHTDVPIADCVSRSYLPKLLRENIHVYMYEKNILHAKYMIIDNEYATVGSTNLDYLSLLRNHETNIIMNKIPAVLALSEQFESDKKFCRKTDWNYWHELPYLYRIAGYIGRIMRKVM